MFVVCLRYSRNREEAEESLQEGFIKVFKSIDQYKFQGSFEGWIRKIMVNCSLQKLRTNPALPNIFTMETTTFPQMGTEDIIASIGVKELINMIQQLSPAYKAVFNLYVFEGLKHREIAQVLGISEGTSKSNLFDARLILQKSVARSLQIATKPKMLCEKLPGSIV